MSLKRKSLIGQMLSILDKPSTSVERNPRKMLELGKIEESDLLGVSLHKEAISGTRRSLKKVLQTAICADYPNDMGQTPLFCACAKDNEATALLLLQYGANPNEKSQEGMTSVHAICFVGNIRLLGKLIEAGGDLRLHDNLGTSSREWAMRNPDSKRRSKMLEFLDKAHLYAMTYSGDGVSTNRFTGYARRPNKQTSLMQIMNLRTGSDSSFEHLKRVQSMGFGKVYLGNDYNGGILSVVPLISETSLYVTNDETFDCGCSTIMIAMEWLNTAVSVKRVKSNAIAQDAVDLLISDAEYLGKIRHPNILLLMGMCQPKSLDSLMIVTERVSDFTLYHFLHKKIGHLSSNQKMCLIHQVCNAMDFIHNQNLIHCGLSSMAIFLVSTQIAKIGNFEYMMESMKAELGKLSRASLVGDRGYIYNWMAPELIQCSPPRFSSDVYSFCCVVWELFAGAPPWQGLQPEEILQSVVVDWKSLDINMSKLPHKMKAIVGYGLELQENERLHKFSLILDWLRADHIPEFKRIQSLRMENQSHNSPEGLSSAALSVYSSTSEEFEENKYFKDHFHNLDKRCLSTGDIQPEIKASFYPPMDQSEREHSFEFDTEPVCVMNKMSRNLSEPQRSPSDGDIYDQGLSPSSPAPVKPASHSHCPNLMLASRGGSCNQFIHLYGQNNNGRSSSVLNGQVTTLPWNFSSQPHIRVNSATHGLNDGMPNVKRLAVTFQQLADQQKLRQAILRGSMAPRGNCSDLDLSADGSHRGKHSHQYVKEVTDNTADSPFLKSSSTPILEAMEHYVLDAVKPCTRVLKDVGSGHEGDQDGELEETDRQNFNARLLEPSKARQTEHHKALLQEIKDVHSRNFGQNIASLDSEMAVSSPGCVYQSPMIEILSSRRSNASLLQGKCRKLKDQDENWSLNAGIQEGEIFGSSLVCGHKRNHSTFESKVQIQKTDGEVEEGNQVSGTANSAGAERETVAVKDCWGYSDMDDKTQKPTSGVTVEECDTSSDHTSDTEKVGPWVDWKLQAVKKKMKQRSVSVVANVHEQDTRSMNKIKKEHLTKKRTKTDKEQELLNIESANSVSEVDGCEFEFQEFYMDDDFEGSPERISNVPHLQPPVFDCNTSTRRNMSQSAQTSVPGEVNAGSTGSKTLPRASLSLKEVSTGAESNSFRGNITSRARGGIPAKHGVGRTVSRENVRCGKSDPTISTSCRTIELDDTSGQVQRDDDDTLQLIDAHVDLDSTFVIDCEPDENTLSKNTMEMLDISAKGYMEQEVKRETFNTQDATSIAIDQGPQQSSKQDLVRIEEPEHDRRQLTSKGLYRLCGNKTYDDDDDDDDDDDSDSMGSDQWVKTKLRKVQEKIRRRKEGVISLEEECETNNDEVFVPVPNLDDKLLLADSNRLWGNEGEIVTAGNSQLYKANLEGEVCNDGIDVENNVQSLRKFEEKTIMTHNKKHFTAKDGIKVKRASNRKQTSQIKHLEMTNTRTYQNPSKSKIQTENGNSGGKQPARFLSGFERPRWDLMVQKSKERKESSCGTQQLDTHGLRGMPTFSQEWENHLDEEVNQTHRPHMLLKTSEFGTDPQLTPIPRPRSLMGKSVSHGSKSSGKAISFRDVLEDEDNIGEDINDLPSTWKQQRQSCFSLKGKNTVKGKDFPAESCGSVNEEVFNHSDIKTWLDKQNFLDRYSLGSSSPAPMKGNKIPFSTQNPDDQNSAEETKSKLEFEMEEEATENDVHHVQDKPYLSTVQERWKSESQDPVSVKVIHHQQAPFKHQSSDIPRSKRHPEVDFGQDHCLTVQLKMDSDDHSTMRKPSKKASFGVHRFYIPREKWPHGCKARLKVQVSPTHPDHHKVLGTTIDPVSGHTETLLEQTLVTQKLRSTMQIE